MASAMRARMACGGSGYVQWILVAAPARLDGQGPKIRRRSAEPFGVDPHRARGPPMPSIQLIAESFHVQIQTRARSQLEELQRQAARTRDGQNAGKQTRR